MCGLHAINNLFGLPGEITKENIDESAYDIRQTEINKLYTTGVAESLEEATQLVPPIEYGHSDSGGQYDIRVVKDTIEKYDRTLIVNGIGYEAGGEGGTPPDEERVLFESTLDPNEEGLVGYIAQIWGSDEGHFICVKPVPHVSPGKWCYIDSIGKERLCLTTLELIDKLRYEDVLGYIEVSRGVVQRGGMYYKKYQKYKNKYLRLLVSLDN